MNVLLLTGKKFVAHFHSCWWIFLSSIFAYKANFTAALFATYCNDVGVWIRPFECSRKLFVRHCQAFCEEAFCEALFVRLFVRHFLWGMLKWPFSGFILGFKPWRVGFQAIEGQVTQQTWQNLVFQGFLWFSQVWPGPERLQTDGVHCVWCPETTVNYKLTLVQASGFLFLS